MDIQIHWGIIVAMALSVGCSCGTEPAPEQPPAAHEETEIVVDVVRNSELRAYLLDNGFIQDGNGYDHPDHGTVWWVSDLDEWYWRGADTKAWEFSQVDNAEQMREFLAIGWDYHGL